MAQLMKAIVPSSPRLSTEEIKRRNDELETAFKAMNEEDQILYLFSQRIGWSWSGPGGRSRDETARHILTDQLGPKFAERVLADPDCRKKLGFKD